MAGLRGRRPLRPGRQRNLNRHRSRNLLPGPVPVRHPQAREYDRGPRGPSAAGAAVQANVSGIVLFLTANGPRYI